MSYSKAAHKAMSKDCKTPLGLSMYHTPFLSVADVAWAFFHQNSVLASNVLHLVTP
jgi:hypothetical protein